MQTQPASCGRPRFRLVFVALVLALTATSAGAGYFTVTLTNGTSFETRYRPVDAEWDDDVAMIRTDRGNWIALRKSEIADVVSQAEASGFGYQVNTTTLFLGWSPNDTLGDEDGEGGEDGDDFGAPGGQEGFFDDGADEGGFSLEQFIDVPVGGGTLPGGFDIGPGAVPSEGSDNTGTDG